VFAQTTATDFTAIDCHGDSYNLYSKLDAGKVVVLAWVMPCSACIADPLDAFTTIQTYGTSQQNRIQFNLVDDFGNTTCSSLSGWANLYGMGNANMISDPVVSMADYGVNGMPKVVIIAGSNHKIYYNENSSSAGFQTALDLALAENPLTIKETISVNYELNVFPNPVNQLLNVSYSISVPCNLTIEIVDILGAKTKQSIIYGEKQIGKHSEVLDVSNLANGIYFLKINSPNGTQMKKFIVSK